MTLRLARTPWTLGTLALTLTLALPLACSDDDDGGNDEVGDGDGDPSGDGDPTTGDGDPTTTGDPTTGDGDPTTGDGDPTTGDGDPTTGDGDPTTGDGDPTTGDGDPEPVDNSTYTAVLMPGGPDRIVITRVNTDDPSCTRMVLVKPGFDNFDITKPPMWAIEEAPVWNQGFCPGSFDNPHGDAVSGSGSLIFQSYDALMTYPCTLNFNFDLDFDTNPPLTSHWKKTGIPVQGVNCG